MLGIRVASIEEGRIRLFIPFREDLIGDARRPAIHGGVISTLADVCAGFAVWTRCRLNDRIATIDLQVDYLRPATAHDLYAEATVRLLGNRVGNAQSWCCGQREARTSMWPRGVGSTIFDAASNCIGAGALGVLALLVINIPGG